MPSASEDLNRLRRAILLADIIQATGVTTQEIRRRSGNALHNTIFWQCAVTGIRQMGETFNGIPSPETCALALSLLERRERFAERIARTDSKETPGAKPGAKGQNSDMTDTQPKIHIPGEFDRATGVQRCVRCHTQLNRGTPVGFEPSQWAEGRPVLKSRWGMTVEFDAAKYRNCGKQEITHAAR